FQRKFLESSGVTLEFPEKSRQWLHEQTGGDPEKTAKFLHSALNNYEYGLKLAGKNSLKITPELLQDPEGYLDTMVKQAYAAKEKGSKNKNEN
ncbi:hypothetical protein KKG05_00195, partial [bacterium]|nr:hypothetical protein [bacterium]